MASNGQFYYEKKREWRRVCLHSEEIRKRQGPFNFDDPAVYGQFVIDLSELMAQSPYMLLAAGLDKEQHVQKYKEPFHPYNLCMNFILERFAQFFLRRRSRGIVVLEARGEKENKGTLKYLVELCNNGNPHVSPEVFQHIAGIYFHPKWCCESGNTRTYIGNELADLVAYPIHKYIRDGIKDRAFDVIEKKLDCYPEYMGRGLKIFP